MFTCQKCGKKFKDKNSLGGHVSSAHGRNRGEGEGMEAPAQAVTVTEPKIEDPPTSQESQPEPSDEDPGVMDRIRQLMRQDYTPKQIKEKFDYSPRTVDQVATEFIKPEGESDEGAHAENGEFPLVTRGTEVYSPEGILKRLSNGNADWALRLEGMMLLRAAQRMNRDDIEMSKMQAEAYAAMIKPTLDLMEKNRDAQDAAAARARESNIEIAHAAAFDVAQGVQGAFSSEMQALKAALPGKPDEMNPMAKMIFSAIQPHMGQLLGQAFSGLTGHRPGAQPQVGQQPLAMAGQPTQAAAPDDAPPSCMKPGEDGEFTEA